ncbi:MAG TPA: DUF3109 family protein [Candidatus Kapabacteria bacterium]|nr:DUF3109 family protein [Candidatus Kapabacteria bacterium]
MTNQFHLELPIYSESARFSIDGDIAKTEFACDLSVCKGACCTLPGGLGAPILREEIEILERIYPIVEKYLPQAALDTIKNKERLYRRNLDASFTIETVGRNECIFVKWEGDIAICAIQAAYLAGEIKDYPKPISCHLFPIRIYREDDGSYYMCYVEESECEGGRKKGMAESTALLDYLKIPLERALGNDRYEDLKKKLLKK